MSAATEHYHRTVDAVVAQYAEQQFAAALDTIEAATPLLLPWRAELAHLGACVQGAAGDPQAALRTLQDAADEGGWWSPEILRDDDDLEALGGLDGFAALVELSAQRWAEANRVRDRTADVVARPADAVRGLLVALHGADEEAVDAAVGWAAATDAGFAVLAVQSSQRTSPAYRSWPDAEVARTEVAEAVAALPDELSDELRRAPRVLAGFSAGGRVALDIALARRPLPVTGVLAVAPASSVDRLPAIAAGPALTPGRLLVGADDDLAADVVAIGEHLHGRGTPLDVDVVAGLGHALPPDLADRLARWL